MVAQLPAPDGVAERVHRRLREASYAQPARGFWRLWLPAHRVQFAGAALLVTAIAISTLMVRHPKTTAPVLLAPVQQGTGLGTAGAERHPASLTPILVPSQSSKSQAAGSQPVKSQPGRKKPAAGHLAKHLAKSSVAQPAASAQGSASNTPATSPTHP